MGIIMEATPKLKKNKWFHILLGFISSRTALLFVIYTMLVHPYQDRAIVSMSLLLKGYVFQWEWELSSSIVFPRLMTSFPLNFKRWSLPAPSPWYSLVQQQEMPFFDFLLLLAALIFLSLWLLRASFSISNLSFQLGPIMLSASQSFWSYLLKRSPKAFFLPLRY